MNLVFPLDEVFRGDSSHFISPLLLVYFLLNSNDDEFGRLERRETDDDDDLTSVYVGLGHRIAQSASDEIGIRGLLALEGADTEQTIHETADIASQGRPEAMVVGFKHRPLDTVIDTLLYHYGCTPDWHVTPFRISFSRERSSAPDHTAASGHVSETIHS